MVISMEKLRPFLYFMKRANIFLFNCILAIYFCQKLPLPSVIFDYKHILKRKCNIYNILSQCAVYQ